MDRNAQVGSTVVIKGELRAQEDVVIAGRIEGTIIVDGHLVMVEPGGHVAADVTARGIVVSGHVNGTLIAEERIELRSSAQVEGEITAPRIAMADGAIFRGRVEMAKETARQKTPLAAAS